MRIFLLLLATCLGVPGLACAASQLAPMQIVLSNQEYPPYLGASMPGFGLMSRVVSTAFLLENVKVRYAFFPNNRALQSARAGLVDGSLGWAITPERLQDLWYSDAVMSLRMVFFQRAGPDISWRTLSDLSRYRIGVTSGNTYSDEFTRLQTSHGLYVETAADDLTNFRKLLAGHIDLFPIDGEVGAMLLSRQFNVTQRRLIVAQPSSFWSADMHVVIWRKQPLAAELIRRFNLGLRQLRASGEYARLVDQTRKEINQPHGSGSMPSGS